MTPREAELIQQLQDKDKQLATANEHLAQAQARITLLEQKIDALMRRLFGAKSEKIDPAQLLFLLQGLKEDEPGKSAEPAAAEESRCSKVPSPPRKERERIPGHLEVIEEVIKPEAVQAAPEDWRQIGQEISERLDYEPARFLCRRTVRLKYVPRQASDEAVPIIAPLPESLLERSIVTPGLLAQILVSKYCDHLPLYRQESIYWSRHQVWLPRQTLADWVGLAAQWLQPIYNLLREEVVATGYLQIDETPIRYLEPGHGKTKLGYLWTYGVPAKDVIYHWEPSRAAACLDNIIPVNFRGTLQCDGYEGYDSFARRRAEAIELAGCMAHVRRKFYEARDQAPKVSAWILRQFQFLYQIEAVLRDTRAGPDLRAARRASDSRMVLDRLHRTFVRLQSRYTPQSALGKAIAYALGQWPSLQLFVNNGRLEIDNNRIENAIRPTAIGKKNWLFIGREEAGQRSAIIYTIIECCRRRGLDPFRYLRDVFTRLPSMTNHQVKDITPEAWAKAQRPSTDQRAAA